ncbi:hypothetical protein HQ447_20975 [bacterium]|nr:hypothetical protein [bacterium]
MSIFNKAKLTNLRKRIEKEYDLEQCPYAQRILETIAECYDECCDEREYELRKEKAEYLGEYQQQDVECECGEIMLHSNIYQHHKFSCPLRHRPKKPTYEKSLTSRADERQVELCLKDIENYAHKKKTGYGSEYLTDEGFVSDWEHLKKICERMGRPLTVFKKRMKSEYNLDLL